ncbi:MAG: hypothetical protein JW999_01210 [Methanotrichaceae archaeon]|nr:hypothetical protein [Methanotrichaceae archaeon]
MEAVPGSLSEWDCLCRRLLPVGRALRGLWDARQGGLSLPKKRSSLGRLVGPAGVYTA